MNKAIIPEVIRKNVEPEVKNQNLNINLNTNIDKRVFQRYETSNVTNNNYTQNKGFLSFVFNLIILPIKLFFKGSKYVWVKLNFPEHLKVEQTKRKLIAKRNKFLMKRTSLYDDEIF